MKKLLTLLLACTMILSMAACGSKNDEGRQDANTPGTKDEVVIGFNEGCVELSYKRKT